MVLKIMIKYHKLSIKVSLYLSNKTKIVHWLYKIVTPTNYKNKEDKKNKNNVIKIMMMIVFPIKSC
jgi:hypothetical protein